MLMEDDGSFRRIGYSWRKLGYGVYLSRGYWDPWVFPVCLYPHPPSIFLFHMQTS